MRVLLGVENFEYKLPQHAGVCDLAASEVERLEIRTSSCYFQHAGVSDVVAASEVECSEIRTSSSYFGQPSAGDVPAVCEVECLEVHTASPNFCYSGVRDIAPAEAQ